MFKRKQNVTLIAMHKEDMKKVHRRTDWSHTCSLCKSEVGIYPSGQRLLKQHNNVTIVCSRCIEKEQLMVSAPVPGALKESLESILNPKYRT